ncbi:MULTISPECIES: winged helix-turn-helix domain-containing tetratricopeptide repeat protein [unclassified Bradyrhizobium]|uniref:winged helix-turn-helix domain-containing tetratricopeptide repeat protein n=1 Tax=unclassified Bradyrhizobium TaxID=2631580 RepID=UPI001CD34741|nr:MULTISPECIES: winged helix-turn-helix domain-containing tetratricopeptide repeat protein [unclassified Bradyrhizobium]MCA1394039.1 winged helix-turn-helix domain-containing protein [Bradyrhizobium sp. IC3123]MCA1501357.1 winged helix-turn-helix domain-containing protein [Bradyrhizobium sp. NBAIM14]
MRYLFQDYALDTDRRELHRATNTERRELCRGADLIPVSPQVFDLLHYLIRNRERVVSKDEIISAIWNGRIVSDAALTTRLNAARTAIGDSGEKQHLIKTLPRKGFRFVGTVHEDHWRAVAATHGSTDTSRLAPAPRLSIVVLPFANIGGDSEQDYFADGVTESLNTDLSRISGSFVIGRHTAFAYKGKPIDLKQIGRELNVRYILLGSVQRAGRRLRVNVQLVSAETGNQLWAERFDKLFVDLLDLQDEIVSRLANALNAELIAAEARRAESTANPDAIDLYFRGRAIFNRGHTPEHLTQAQRFFERALALDPACLEALVGRAEVDVILSANFMTDDAAPRLAAAETLLGRALSLAPQHAMAHLQLGLVEINTNRASHGIAACERALALDRNLAEAHAWIGLAKIYVGRAEEAEAHILEALRLSPRDIRAFRWLIVIGGAKLHLGAGEEAVVWLRRSIEANRNNPLSHFWLADALTRIGELDEAKATAQAALALDPTFTIRRLRDTAPSNNPTFLAGRERFYGGLRLAGVPEG